MGNKTSSLNKVLSIEKIIRFGEKIGEFRDKNLGKEHFWLNNELLNAIRKMRNLSLNLREERDVLKVIMENTEAHLAYLNANFKFIDVNSTYAKGSGFSRKELIGKNHFDLFPNVENQEIFKKVRDTGKAASFKAKPFVFEGQRERGITYWDWTLIPVKNSFDKTQGLVLSLLDVTERKKTEQRILVQYKVAKALSEAELFDTGVSKVLEVIGQNLNWDFGSYWELDTKEDALVCFKTWSSPTILTKEFEKITYQNKFQLGKGLPGRVWENRKPFWITDVYKDNNFPRKNAAIKEGLHGAFAFPILIQGKVVGVIDFLSRAIQVPDEEMLKVMESISVQIGQFMERKKAENDFIESEERFKLVFNGSAIGISLIDLEGRIIMCNPAFEKMLGYSLKELRRKFFIDFTHENDTNLSLNAFNEMIKGKKDYIQIEKRYYKKNGEEIFVRLNASLFKNTIGNPEFIISMIEDITEQKLAEESLQELNKKVVSVLESITDAFFALDKKLKFSYINKQAERLLQKTRDKLLGKSFWKELPEFANTMFYSKLNESLKTGVSTNFEMLCKPLKNRWFEIRLYPTKEGMAIYFQDITERKEIEKRKDEFISIASHELKTPLTSVKAYAQILQKQHDSLSRDMENRYFSRIIDQLNKLTKIVANLLDVSKMQSGNFEFHEEKFSMGELINDIAGDFKNIEKDHKIIIKGICRKKILADKDRISQVITNLISNAIKYSPEANKVVIQLSQEEESIVVGIRDFGIGISGENQEKIFERFFRITSEEKRRFPGLGLGLYICQRIISHYGGKIWVESKEGKGSTFYFNLPYNKNKSN